MGFLGVAIPERFGGAGAGYLELCVIAEEMGRALAPVPFASSIYLAAELLMLAGSDAQKAKWLRAIASGAAVGNAGAVRRRGQSGLQGDQGIRLARCDLRHQGARRGRAIADFAIVAARTALTGRESDIGLFLVDLSGDGIQRKTLTNIDQSHNQAEITFDRCKAEPLGADERRMEHSHPRARSCGGAHGIRAGSVVRIARWRWDEMRARPV